jgi:hypothetical protein
MWHYGDSSAYEPSGHFTARYSGVIRGDHVDGTVIWNGAVSGTWHATAPKSLCNPFSVCPLTVQQLLEFRQNAARAGQNSAALRSYLIAASQGNATARRLADELRAPGVGR